ncbi:HAMP domain-containing sensor histidine kinase [Enterococcus pseudoavium]|uniref:Heme sensor protein HssS n=1 Tax=Enterococcus pseudoavium TaxID=44007 RepID=A0ABU3FHX6_9ENTE|nr:HAMP domain-containing sensor histidine kinase [Enterococcus pseudoavium]MDT2753455.1 HAMP domain-containing sensor histidine kinase [Enterococcus pseudoavium]MDT2770674.1 HAMP domain-containing sensor histidine kinase [Enterococcus pseudoavium]
MRKKLFPQLWMYFVAITFLLMVIVLFVFVGLLVIVNHFRLLSPEREGHLFPFYFIIFLSLVIGAALSVFVGKRILQPIGDLRQAMSSVAKGDFTVQLKEQQQMEDVAELYHDFNLMVKELSSIETLRNDFVSTVSHEFKTPIATIKGYVQLLQNDALPLEERQIYLERMLDGTQQLTHLTDNILKLSKLENQGLGLDFQTFRLDEQIREVILFLQPKWEQLNLILDLFLPRTSYYGNEEFLYQVWLNLMDNAIKYSQKNGRIQVTLTSQPTGDLITISDEGAGMTPEVISRIFDKFYQSDTSRKTKGNGLGLALAKQIVQLHAGTIKVKSSPNKGSKFIIFLPNDLKNS